MNETSDEYRQGYRDAMAQAREDLALTLRDNAVDRGEDDAEVLSDRMVREIFTGTFGVRATDEEFGPEPSGKGVRAVIELRACG